MPYASQSWDCLNSSPPASLSPPIFLIQSLPSHFFFSCYPLYTIHISFLWSSSGFSYFWLCFHYLSWLPFLSPLHIWCSNHFTCFTFYFHSIWNWPNSTLFFFISTLSHTVFPTILHSFPMPLTAYCIDWKLRYWDSDQKTCEVIIEETKGDLFSYTGEIKGQKGASDKIHRVARMVSYYKHSH